MKEFDVVVIGSGPGGYVAAIRCSQLGMKTAIVEKYPTLGGTCLNVGCIPSKAWLDSSERFFSAIHHNKNHGILASEVKLDLKKMSERVRGVVKDNSQGVSFLMKKNKIEVFHGHGQFISKTEVEVLDPKSKSKKVVENLKAKNFIIATGSKPASLPGVEIDKKRIITSTEALVPSELPKRMIVIGGGVIGLELGSVYQRLGTEVEVVEFADRIIAGMDKDLSKNLQKVLKKEGIKFHTSHAVESAKVDGNKVVVTAKSHKKDGKTLKLEADYCLVAVGRSPYTENLGLENAGIELDDRGRIIVNEKLQTKASGIYAIGDVIKGPMLAHKAEEEGVLVAELIDGQKPHIHYHLIPSVVYTWPEVSSVGYTPEQLDEKGLKYKVGSFPFKASGRARASDEYEGMIKVLADEKTDEILGVHMIGPRCADLIAEATLAMEYRASAEDVARVCHPHPTYSEAFKEACLAATENRALHI